MASFTSFFMCYFALCALLELSAARSSSTLGGGGEKVVSKSRLPLDGEQNFFAKVGEVWVSRTAMAPPSFDGSAADSTTAADGKRLVTLVRERDDQGEWHLVDCTLLSDGPSILRFKSRVMEALMASKLNSTGAWQQLSQEEGTPLTKGVDTMVADCEHFRTSALSFAQLAEEKDSNSVPDESPMTKIVEMEQKRRSKRSYLIFPGTNWCGKGNMAKHVAHFGAKSEEDKCCKSHDLCPYSIAGFSSRYNLFNYRLHTLTHCECDTFFKDCLKEANSGTANVIGKVYFNVVNTQCFDLKLEKICAKRTWWGSCDRQGTQWVAQLRTLGSY